MAFCRIAQAVVGHEEPQLRFNVFFLIAKRVMVGDSAISSPAEIGIRYIEGGKTALVISTDNFLGDA